MYTQFLSHILNIFLINNFHKFFFKFDNFRIHFHKDIYIFLNIVNNLCKMIFL